MLFEHPDGSRYVSSAASLPVLGPGDPVYGTEEVVTHAFEPAYKLRWRSGTRRMEEASFTFSYPDGRTEEHAYEVSEDRAVLDRLGVTRARDIKGGSNREWLDVKGARPLGGDDPGHLVLVPGQQLAQ